MELTGISVARKVEFQVSVGKLRMLSMAELSMVVTCLRVPLCGAGETVSGLLAVALVRLVSTWSSVACRVVMAGSSMHRCSGRSGYLSQPIVQWDILE